MIEATVTGNVGRAPELKMARSGKQMAGFSVASNEKKDAPTTWVEVVCFDEQADMVCQSLQKGDRVVVTGRMALETFQKKDGSAGFSLRLMANEVGRSLRWPRRSAGGMPEVSEVEDEAAEPIPF